MLTRKGHKLQTNSIFKGLLKLSGPLLPWQRPPPEITLKKKRGRYIKTSAMLGPFPHPHGEFIGSHPRSILELRLNGLSAIIRNKPDWHIKRLDPTIVAKWREEAIAQHVTPVQFKFVIDELAYYDKLRNESIQVADVDGVYRSSDFLPLELKSDFARHVVDLAEIPEEEKDWHPGSDNTVLDLIHPGLYLFVSGKTRTIPRGQSVTHASVPANLPKGYSGQFRSSEYQWIPTPISVDQDGKVEFLSYINNLHPKWYHDLYAVLANILSLTLPVFERVLTFLKSPLKPKIDLGLHEMYDESTEPKQMDGEDQDTFDNRYEEWYDNRPLNPILVPEFSEPSSEPPIVLRNCRLQVIVKIQEIHLTPEKPSYAGGVWHVEGMENESIVASAIYYYECSNITECTLSFRQSVREPDYEQNDHQGVEALYGLRDGEPLVQNLGSVTTKVDTLVKVHKLISVVWTFACLAQHISTPSFVL